MITKSSITVAKTTTRLAITDGQSIGKSTKRNACHLVAPRSLAASSNDAPIETSRALTMTTTLASENVTLPNNWATNPSGTAVNKRVKVRSNAAPTTISGVISGVDVKPWTKFALRPRMRCEPIAKAMPSGVTTSIVANANTSEFEIAFRVSSLRKIEAYGSVIHQRSEKPCQTVRLRPSLKE